MGIDTDEADGDGVLDEEGDGVPVRDGTGEDEDDCRILGTELDDADADADACAGLEGDASGS